MALTKVDDRGLKTPIDLLDDEKIRLGTNNEFELYQDSSTDYGILRNIGQGTIIQSAIFNVKNAGGNKDMIVATTNNSVDLYYNNSKKLETTNTGVSVTGGLTASGASTFNEDVTFIGDTTHLTWDRSNRTLQAQDNAKIKFGTSGDLEIYHNGSNSYIKNTTGWLNVLSDTIFLGNAADSEAYLKAVNNGSVELYYDHSKKFETTSGGASVTGSLGVGTTSPARELCVHSSDSGSTYMQLTNTTTGTGTGDGFIVGIGGDEVARLWNYEDTAIEFGTNSTERLKITNDGNVQIPADNKKLQLGASQDFEIYHDGTYNILKSNNSHNLEFKIGSNTVIKAGGGGEAQLLYSGSKKIETTNTGATVTGTLTATAFSGAGIIPAGGIIIWSGASNAIPTGWLICDGSNSTPDLRDRFVIGAGNNYAVGATGGSADATLVSHSHTTNSTINPSDTNTKDLQGTISAVSETFGTSSGTASGIFTKISNVMGQHTPSGVDTSGTGAFNIDARHRHGTDTQGSSATNANLPPYYALCYIMKS